MKIRNNIFNLYFRLKADLRSVTFFFLLTYSGLCQGQQLMPGVQPIMPVFRQVSYPFLPSITSNNFYFTRDGLMWFSTANGLTSFDGTSILYHTKARDVSNMELTRIAAFAEDEFHNLYLGTRTGMYYFNRKSKLLNPILYEFKPPIKYDAVAFACFYIDKNGIVYAGSAAEGLFIYNPHKKSIDHVNLDKSKPDNWLNWNGNTVKCIKPHVTDENKLWLGTFNGIYLFDKTKKDLKKDFNVLNPTLSADGKPKAYYDVQFMELLNDSTIWFNSWAGGFCEYSSNKGYARVHLKRISGDGNSFNSIIPSFIRISENFFFIGAHRNKSCLFDFTSKKMYPVNITGTLNFDDRVDFVTKDKQNNLWILRNGLLYTNIPEYGRLRSTEIDRQLTPDNNGNELRGIFYDTVTKKYYGAVRHSSGVYVFDSSFRLLEIIPTPLYTNTYTYKETCTDKVTIDGSHRVWVTGLETYIMLPGKKRFDYIRNVMPSLQWLEKKGEFFSLLTLKNGDIAIFGENANLYIINHKTLYTDTAKIQQFDYSGKYNIGLTQVLYDSARSLLYYSNNDGVLQYNLNNKAIRMLSETEFLGYDQSGFPTIQMALDYKGRIWAMRSPKSLRIMDPITLKCIDSFNIGSRGLRVEQFTNIVYGGKDYMFLQGQNGIVIYDYSKQQSFSFDNTNGLRYPIPYSMLHSNGRLVIGQWNAVQFYNTELFSKNNFILYPRVNQIFSDTSIIYDRETNDSLENIRLKYFQNNLRFSFSAPEFIFPERIEYAYQLSGFEDDWQYASYFKREVSYTRLPPGSYVFRLKAQMQGGNWNVMPIEYQIIIKEASWQTSLFKTLLSIVIGVIIVLFFVMRVRFIRKKEKQKLFHEKQLLELEAQALRAQMNPHFIYNCMNSIKALIHEDEKQRSIDYLTTFSKLIRTLFQNSDKRQITLHDEIESCRLYTQLEAMRLNGKLKYDFEIAPNIDMKSVMVPALIIQPFIENAIWHGIVPKNEGEISVKVKDSGNAIICTVDDNGIGREMSKLNKPITPLIHESKGVHLSMARLNLEKKLNETNARIETIDKHAGDQPAGTRVIITFNLQ